MGSFRLKGLSQFTRWIKLGSYYHGVVAEKGLHLAGILPPMRPQIHPSETQALMQKMVETPTASLHMPGKMGVATQGASSNTPTPMETGRAGDGHSWVNQVNVCLEEERRDRPAKYPLVSSRRWDPYSINPFPLQDSKARHEAVQQLYHHAGELAPCIMMWLPREWPPTTLIWRLA